MKWKASIPLVLMAALAVADAEDLPPQPLSPGESKGAMEEPALPAPEPSPLNPEPGLLPESGELPARPPAEAPAKSSSRRSPTQQALEQEGRFDTVRSMAMDSQRALSLLRRARHTSSSSTRRTYLRAYYLTVASRMRRLDPELKASINAYEEAKLNELSGAGTSTSHHARRHQAVRLSGHRRLHRVSYENRYRRFIIIDAPYGPPFPPYGPPVIFEPW